jgi:hypothetical protein
MAYGIKPLPIKGFENYFVTKDGKVFNTINSKQNILDTPVEIKAHQNKVTGYMQTTLQNKATGMKAKTLYVHRLVAETYLEKPSNKHTQVNHKNFNKADNRIDNLEWVTPQQNKTHANILISNLVLQNHLKVNDRLLKVGIRVYSITEKLEDAADVWNCSEAQAGELLRENGIDTMMYGKNKLPSTLRNKLIEDIKEQKEKQEKLGFKVILSKDFMEQIEKKYNTKFSKWYLYRIKKIALQ